MTVKIHVRDRNHRGKRKRKRWPSRQRTAIWSLDGTTLLAVVEGHVTPDVVEAARLLALRVTTSTTS